MTLHLPDEYWELRLRASQVEDAAAVSVNADQQQAEAYRSAVMATSSAELRYQLYILRRELDLAERAARTVAAELARRQRIDMGEDEEKPPRTDDT